MVASRRVDYSIANVPEYAWHKNREMERNGRDVVELVRYSDMPPGKERYLTPRLSETYASIVLPPFHASNFIQSPASDRLHQRSTTFKQRPLFPNTCRILLLRKKSELGLVLCRAKLRAFPSLEMFHNNKSWR